MKKILSIVLLVMSLQVFGANYKVTKAPEVKMTQREMESNGIEIERAYKEAISGDRIKKAMEDEIKKQGLGNMSNEEVMFIATLGSLVVSATENIKTEIKEINYTSPDKAVLTVEVKTPKMELIDEKNLEKKLDAELTRKLGYSFKNIENKNFTGKEMEKFINVGIPAYITVLNEEISKIREFETTVEKIEIEKINNKWQMELF